MHKPTSACRGEVSKTQWTKAHGEDLKGQVNQKPKLTLHSARKTCKHWQKVHAVLFHTMKVYSEYQIVTLRHFAQILINPNESNRKQKNGQFIRHKEPLLSMGCEVHWGKNC